MKGFTFALLMLMPISALSADKDDPFARLATAIRANDIAKISAVAYLESIRSQTPTSEANRLQCLFHFAEDGAHYAGSAKEIYRSVLTEDEAVVLSIFYESSIGAKTTEAIIEFLSYGDEALFRKRFNDINLEENLAGNVQLKLAFEKMLSKKEEMEQKSRDFSEKIISEASEKCRDL